MATQAAAAYAAKKTMNDAAQQVGSPNMGDEQEAKPAGVKEWLLRFGAIGNCEFICCQSIFGFTLTSYRPHSTLFHLWCDLLFIQWGYRLSI